MKYLLSSVIAILIVIYVLTYVTSDSDILPTLAETKHFVLRIAEYIRALFHSGE